MNTMKTRSNPFIGCCALSDESYDELVAYVGGSHTLEFGQRLTFSDASLVKDHIQHSGLFTYETDPFQYKHSLYFEYKPSRIGPRGIHITLRMCKFIPGYRKGKDVDYTENSEELSCMLTIRVNPKLMLGIDDYVGIATERYMVNLKKCFDRFCNRVSPVMRDSSWYQIRRADACMNIELHQIHDIDIAEKKSHMIITPEMIIHLFRMGDIPSRYSMYEGEKNTTNRSLYLYSKSCIVNFYCKNLEMMEKHTDVKHINQSRDIVRLEIQQLYGNLVGKLSTFERMFDNAVETVCSDEWTTNTVCKYYWKIVGGGDWYRYKDAIRRITKMNCRADKKDRMIWVLDKIKSCGSVNLAKKECCDEKEKVKFVNSLNDLRSIGINGVCIPDEWKIGWIPNILECWLKREDIKYVA